MKLFDVYPLFDIEPVKAQGSYVWDKTGQQYLDFYGGHAVISIGHSHPYYVSKLKAQLDQIAFYSNSVKIPLQEELSQKLGTLSGYSDYDLFLCNSGAEANENAFKLASFYNKRKKIIAFHQSFHGRTSLAVAATDDTKIVSSVNQTEHVQFLPLNDEEALTQVMNEDVCAVILEGIQGVGGVNIPTSSFLHKIRTLCDTYNAVMIMDEVQSGYGRSGKFFAHQHANVKPDLITVAKGMGNGFPVAGVLISPKFESKHGMLGTTFGGNYLACAAAIAVLDVMAEEQLIKHAEVVGNNLMQQLVQFKLVKEIRGLGLMIGVEFEFPCNDIRNKLLYEHHIFTGSSSNKNTLRLLPALNLKEEDVIVFINAFEKVITSQAAIV